MTHPGCARVANRLVPLSLASDPAEFAAADWAGHLGGALPAPAITGALIGVALNTRAERDAMGPALSQPPYRAPPVAPVLFVQPAVTWAGAFDDIPVPAGATALETGASLAVVLGADAIRVSEGEAWSRVAGLTLVNAFGLTAPDVFRPPVRFRCHDGFCPVGPWVVSCRGKPPALPPIEVSVNGQVCQSIDLQGMVLDAAGLLARVSAFMTLRAGDALMLGLGAGRPMARVGDVVGVRCPGVGRLENRLVAEQADGEAPRP